MRRNTRDRADGRDVPVVDVRRARQQEARQRRTSLREQWEKLVTERPPMTFPAAAEALGVSVAELAQVVPPRDRRLLLPSRRIPPPQRTDREILAGLRAVAAELGTDRLTLKQYDAARRSRADLLGGVRVVQRFGTWSEACRQAGLEVLARRSVRGRRWTRQEMLAAVVDYLKDPGVNGTGWEYEVWRAGRGVAGLATLRNVFGSWHAVRTEALDVIAGSRRKPRSRR